MNLRALALAVVALAVGSCTSTSPSQTADLAITLEEASIVAKQLPCPIGTPCPPPVVCPPRTCPVQFYGDVTVILGERRGRPARWESLVMEVSDAPGARTKNRKEYTAEQLAYSGADEIAAGETVRFRAMVLLGSDPAGQFARAEARVRWDDGRVADVTAEVPVRLP